MFCSFRWLCLERTKKLMASESESQPSQSGQKRLRKPLPLEHQQRQPRTSNEEQHCRTRPFELHCQQSKMLTKYLTSVTTAFSPFNPKSGKTARNFLALLPPTAHKTMTIDVKVLSQAQKAVPATMALKFSMFERERYPCQSQEGKMFVDL
jgi:hypothetical protein